MKARLCLVVAMARNRVIGKDGGLPWHIPEDLRRFKAVTMGKPMIMGRKTFESIGRPLPGRTSIVVTRNTDYTADGIVVVEDLSTAIDAARKVASADGVTEIMVIGGSEIYAVTLPFADRIYMTEILRDIDGDVQFPPYSSEVWQEAERTSHKSNGDMPDYDFVVLDKIEETK